MAASHRLSLATLFLLMSASGDAIPAFAQTTAADQVARAVLAAPESLRDGATVLGYGGEPREGDPLTTLREGDNGIICLADDPADDRFHVACYHESMDEYMALGRRLEAAGEGRDAILSARQSAIDAGELEPPSAALWSLTVEADVEPEAGIPSDARRLSVIYVPYAGAADLGLPTRPDGDSPWLMLPGTPWAHVMISR
ncbi:MAG: hypothetical protein ACODAA_05690 [Gemmatimonadota bacterium]